MTLEYELVDANGVCLGTQKVRVEPATKSAVATCLIPDSGNKVTRHVVESNLNDSNLTLVNVMMTGEKRVRNEHKLRLMVKL